MYMAENKNTLCKAERLNSKKTIEMLFSGSAGSFSTYPVRAVFLPVKREESETSVSIMVSVPKKKFKRAVKRNRIKRQLREAYRKNKHQLIKLIEEKEQRLLIAFIFSGDKLLKSDEIEQKMTFLLKRIEQKMTQEQ